MLSNLTILLVISLYSNTPEFDYYPGSMFMKDIYINNILVDSKFMVKYKCEIGMLTAQDIDEALGVYDNNK